MIIDNHVHVGWYLDGFHAPRAVWDSEMAAGVCGMAVSSTSTCAELYKNVLRELRELVRLGGERVRPILWLTPRMMKLRYPLPLMLHSKIRWRGIKLHFEAHPEWSRNKVLLQKALAVARRLNVPVLLHTGEFDVCHAGLFKDIISEDPDLTFVLAHGRPVDEAIDVLHACPNAYVDTAFMSMPDLKALVSAGLVDRVLFGTDAPINMVFYKDISTADYLRRTIEETKGVLGDAAPVVFARCLY